MDYRRQIIEEYSKRGIIAIADDIGDDPEKFAQLMDLYTEGDYRLTPAQRMGSKGSWRQTSQVAEALYRKIDFRWCRKTTITMQYLEITSH